MREQSMVSRRRFLAGVGLGLATVAVSPSFLVAANPARPLRLGSGKHTYEWVPNWAKLPSGVELSNCHGGIVIDSQNRILVNTDTDNAVMVFDADGKFVKGFGKDFKGGSHGMMIRKEGNQEFLYLTHTARHELIKITADGELVWTRGYPTEPGVYTSANEYKPTGVAFAPNGDIFVTDGYGKYWVHHYNTEGDYIRSWGGAGSEPGKLNNPHGIWVDTRRKTPILVVADRGNKRLQTFTMEGKHIGFVTEDMRLPSNMDQRGSDIVVADLDGKVTILDKENKIITHLGDNTDPKKRGTNKIPSAEWTEGVFIAPHCPRWDKQGNLYIHEWSLAGRTIKLRRV